MFESSESHESVETQVPASQDPREIGLSDVLRMREEDIKRRKAKKEKKRIPGGSGPAEFVSLEEADREEKSRKIRLGRRYGNRNVAPGQVNLVGPNQPNPEEQIIRREDKEQP